MLYREFIRVDEEFQYSINLQYDLNKLTKINGYIPTSLSLEILLKYLESIYNNSKEKATVLIGPYGKGKSHLLLILLAIMSLKDDVYDEDSDLQSSNVISDLVNKIGKIDQNSKTIIEELRKQKKRLLPVIINGNYRDLKQAFLLGLKNALEREGLESLTPNTYYDAVIKTVDLWSKNYPSTFMQFKDKLINKNLSLEAFLNRIKEYDEKVYEIFREIHPLITSGTEFNPLINSDIIELYNQVNNKICETEKYSGIFIVFDEFSKFLEASVARDLSEDSKILQDFAELANRTTDNQLYLTCITHKAINDYINNIPHDKIHSWRAVEGRFKEIYFTSSSEQQYELIANAINKDNSSFEVFLNDNENKFEENLEYYSQLGLFRDIDRYEEIVGKGCFPLNPISAYVLPRVSEKIAQNERTLFTFLARDEKGSLARFISEHDGTLRYLSLDSIYDYFETLFMKEVFNQNIHSAWLKASTLLKKTDDETQKSIIKALAVILIVNELDILKPRDAIIQAALSLEKKEYEKAITTLLNKQILFKKKSNNYYEFLTAGHADLNKDILAIKETKASKINVSQVLGDIADLGYALPKRYNDTYEMTRFFKNIFITSGELEELTDAEGLIRAYKSDGIILNLIYENDNEKQNSIKKVESLGCERLILSIPNSSFNKYDELREHVAIQYLKSDEQYRKENDLFEQELLVYEADVVDSINQYVEQSFGAQYANNRFYGCLGLLEDVSKPAHISRKLSEICEEVFSKTPIINNEMINKNTVSSQIVKARNKMIHYIFEEMDKENRNELTGSGPEVTIFRATIKNKGLDRNNQCTNDSNLDEVLNVIKKFILSSESEKRGFSELYSTLNGKDFGLRMGLIPIYLALIIKDFKDGIVIYNRDKEVVLTIDTLNAINSSPEQYSLLLEKGTIEKDDYINAIAILFNGYKGSQSIGYNRFSNIVASMQNWMQSLPKFSREYEVNFTNDRELMISKEIINLRKELLRFDINPREFLFERLRKKVLKNESFVDCVRTIEVIKKELDNHLNLTKDTLINRTKGIVESSYNGELSTLLKHWYSELSENSKKRAYDITTNSFLGYISNLTTYNDSYVIEHMARLITGLNIEDWNDDVFRRYMSEIAKIKETIESYQAEVAIDENHTYQFTFYHDGQKVEKMFESEPISPLGGTLLDALEQSLEDYGDSIDVNEKRNILMELMQRFI